MKNVPIKFFSETITKSQFNDTKLTDIYFNGVKVFPGDFTRLGVIIDYINDDIVMIKIINSNDYSVECILKDYFGQQILYMDVIAAYERRTITLSRWADDSMKVELMSIDPYTGDKYYDYAEWRKEETTTTTPLRMSVRNTFTEGNFTLYKEEEK